MTWCFSTRTSTRTMLKESLLQLLEVPVIIELTLQWCHNEHNDVSNHQSHNCLLNRLFRGRSKKTSKLRVTGLCVGNSPVTGELPHKGPVTRKMFPFDDIIMISTSPAAAGLIVIDATASTAAELMHSPPVNMTAILEIKHDFHNTTLKCIRKIRDIPAWTHQATQIFSHFSPWMTQH